MESPLCRNAKEQRMRLSCRFGFRRPWSHFGADSDDSTAGLLG
jgi:hypothetical protein